MSNLLSHHAELETKLREEQKSSQEKLSLLNIAQQKLADKFKALSADALQNNNQSFLTLAQTALENFCHHEAGKMILKSDNRQLMKWLNL